MVPRKNGLPNALCRRNRVLVTLQRGQATRSFSVRPAILYGFAVALPVLLTLAAASMLAVVFRDDLVVSLVTHQHDLAAHYRERIARLTREIDATKAADRIDRDLLEHKLDELVQRQKALETRAATVAALAGELHAPAGAGGRTVAARKQDGSSSALTPLIQIGGASAPALPAGTSAFAPAPGNPTLTARSGAAESAKPQPEPVDVTPADDAAVSGPPALRSELDDGSLPLPQRLQRVAQSIDAAERVQDKSVDALADAARQRSSRLRTALSAIGLDPARLKVPSHEQGGIGGPFVPLRPDAGHSELDRKIALLEGDLLGAGRLSRIAPYLPLGIPVSEQLEVTSSFGGRPDPFTGRMMMHTGVDLREEWGAPIHATGAGRVEVAGPAGGYGNMVEIDHGNGLVTRYGHLSSIGVRVGEWVHAGETIGHAGSTGRSTGPHLHYEVRIDGEAVDPMPFIRAGEKIYAMN